MDGTHETEIPRLSAFRTLRLTVRDAWDALGLLCAISLTLFTAAALPTFLFLKSAALGALIFCLVQAPLSAGACLAAHKVFEHDEASYLDLWRGFRRFYIRGVVVGAAQVAVAGVLLLYIAFYSARSGFGFLLLSILMWYALVFWGMNCIYHYPLLVAADERIIMRDNGSPMRLRAVFRNGFLLSMTSPAYSLSLVLTILLLLIPLALSGVGLALVGAGFPAFMATRASRDQLIKHGVIPPDPDPESPVVDEVWKMRG